MWMNWWWVGGVEVCYWCKINWSLDGVFWNGWIVWFDCDDGIYIIGYEGFDL